MSFKKIIFTDFFSNFKNINLKIIEKIIIKEIYSDLENMIDKILIAGFEDKKYAELIVYNRE